MKKGEFCEDYVGVTCIDGTCPVANYELWPEYFSERPSCATCGYVKG